MNHIYRSIWNDNTGTFVAVSENSTSGGKSSSAGTGVKVPMLKALAVSLALAFSGQLYALPVDGVVTKGAATVTSTAGSMTIQQTSQNAALDWRSFSIGQGEAVRFVQPNSTSVALNRVLGADPSSILGSLSANGKVFLVNPNGILFGAGATVNVGGLVASTLNISDADFMAGKYRFVGDSTATVSNAGAIHADGSYVALLGAKVSNQGLISARLGTVALAAGQAVTLDVAGDGLINVAIERGAASALVNNGGMIVADGGQVVLSAQSAGALLPSVVNHSGVIQAQTVENHNGVIRLLGGMHDGSIHVAGKLDASAPVSGDGGFIETSAARVAVADGASITTAAANGKAGTWLIDPIDFTIAAGSGGLTTSGIGANTLSTSLGSGNVSIATDASTAGNGDIFVNSAVSWAANKLTLTAHRNIMVNANLNASGSASLALEYGQGAVGAGNTSSVITNGGAINLPASSTNFTTKRGSNGIVKAYTVITSLGAAGSTTAADLQGMGGNLALNYALGANIDASATAGWNAGAGFLPVGSSASVYGGNFDGLGHTISNLTINRPSTNWVGLFAYSGALSELRNVSLSGSVSGGSVVGALAGMNDGALKNVHTSAAVVGGSFLGGLVGSNAGNVSDSDATGMVTGADQVGGLVGGHNSGTISNSFATGNVVGTGGATGGLVGYASATITNSHASGAVSGASGVGGLLAAMNGGTVSNSYATGAVTGIDTVGGLIGNSTFGTLNDVYATGAVNGANGVGGLIGTSDSATINRSYATGLVSATGTKGGLIGTHSGTVNSGYWNSTVNGATPGIGSGNTAGATGLSTAQMGTAANFAGFTFTSTPGATGNNWVMIDVDSTLNNAGGQLGGTLPMLASEYATTINNAHQLQLMNVDKSASYKLGRSIDAATTAGTTDVWSGTFVPVGRSTSRFTGSLDGQGYIINNLRINQPATTYSGLFGYINPSAVISNLGLVGGSVTGLDYVGPLAGYNNGGTISNTWASVPVSGSGNRVGGLIGHNQGGTLTNLYATGTVAGAAVVGGLLGGDQSGTISNSYASGAATGAEYVGGLIGAEEAGILSNSYATGAASAPGDNVGGLTGYLWGSTVTNTYATGAVSGANFVGGLIGFRNEAGAGPSTVASSYWNTDVTAAGVGGAGLATGVVGMNTAQMTVPANYAGFNFTTAGGATGNNWVTVSGNGTLNNNGGNGTRPMLASEYSTSIASDHQLQLMRMNLAANYTLARDLDLTASMADTGSVWGANAGFVAIGGVYTGTFDGLNHTITGFKLNRPGSVYQGLFGSTSAASTIRNVGLVGGSVTGDNYIGSLVGRLGGTISNSYSTASVTGGPYLGGLVGYTETGSLVTNSYAGGTVSGIRAGGLVGRNDGTVSNSYAFGAVSGSSSGGLVGLNNGGTVTDSFWNTTTSGAATSDGGAGLTDAAMKQAASFNIWNTSPSRIAGTYSGGAQWRIYEGNSMPLLTSFLSNQTLADARDAAVTYNGSAQSGGSAGAQSGLLGTAASGVNAGFYGGYYSNQQGLNLIGGNLTIGKANLTLSGTRAYDGSQVMAGSTLTANGVAGETFLVSGAGNGSNLASKNVQTGSTLSSITGLTLGASGNGGLTSNYNALSTSGSSIDITKANLTLRSNDVVKTYNGNTAAAGVAAVGAGTLFGSDSLSGGTFAFTDQNAGTGNKIVTPAA